MSNASDHDERVERLVALFRKDGMNAEAARREARVMLNLTTDDGDVGLEISSEQIVEGLLRANPGMRRSRAEEIVHKRVPTRSFDDEVRNYQAEHQVSFNTALEVIYRQKELADMGRGSR